VLKIYDRLTERIAEFKAPDMDRAQDVNRYLAHASVLLRDLPENLKVRIPEQLKMAKNNLDFDQNTMPCLEPNAIRNFLLLRYLAHKYVF